MQDMITVGDAKAQAAALRVCADASPVRQFKYPLLRQAKEWEHAATELEGSEDEADIELASSVVPGMLIPCDDGWVPVIRVLLRDGQCSLHYEDQFDPRGRYRNLGGPTSPVVVKR